MRSSCAAGLVAAFAVALAGCGNGPAGRHAAPGDGIELLTGSGTPAAGFARALRPRPFMFPRDHGAHRAYRTEWWYYTGNLATRDERRFGFELTFFRIALAPQAPVSRSAWASNQIWMAHLAVSDIAAKRFVAEQRLSRGALGLAGATAQPFKVWVEDWSAAGRLGARNGAIRLQARGKKAAIDLDLSAVQPPVPEGNAGLDPKGPEPGNASYYYSIPRLAVTGTVEPPDGSSERVHGLAWMDREWSSSALGPDITGWDWFGLQLADGRDLMFYRLRTAQGGASSFSGGSLIEPDGSRRRLGAKDVETAPLRRWRSPASGVEYPVAWRLRTAAGAGDLDLHVEPALEDQELRLAVRYWEGAVRVSGTAAGKPISGRGYLELAGYR